MNLAERFWWALTVAALVWYVLVTTYVGIKGGSDIKRMLAALGLRRPPS